MVNEITDSYSLASVEMSQSVGVDALESDRERERASERERERDEALSFRHYLFSFDGFSKAFQPDRGGFGSN